MNILYLADPNSIHDLKWISFFSNMEQYNTFILPRYHHFKFYKRSNDKIEIKILNPIHDFSILRFYQTCIDAWRIKRIIKRNKIDLIHILYAEPNALWCLFKRYFNIPMIISCRGTDVLKTIPETFKKKTLINYIVAPAYKRAFLMADMVTGTSKSQLKSIVNLTDRNNRMKLVRTGVDIQHNTSISQVNLPEEIKNNPYILFPRFIKPIYNHEFCLEAIRLLPEEIKQSYQMVFVGKNDGDLRYQQIIEGMIREIPDANILFLGKQSQDAFHELIKRSSIVVM
ncbi:MAG: glycosyltransferase, partial [Cyclobacteriaceae bacterium]|nr:glycosyltransferase [Cyclobacteriaceae bacterium]